MMANVRHKYSYRSPNIFHLDLWANQRLSSEFVNGRQEIVEFLTRKWAKELDYRLIKQLWALWQSHRGALCL
jgi:nuclear transport factor 2 (NTF2) superfamily protein